MVEGITGIEREKECTGGGRNTQGEKLRQQQGKMKVSMANLHANWIELKAARVLGRYAFGCAGEGFSRKD